MATRQVVDFRLRLRGAGAGDVAQYGFDERRRRGIGSVRVLSASLSHSFINTAWTRINQGSRLSIRRHYFPSTPDHRQLRMPLGCRMGPPGWRVRLIRLSKHPAADRSGRTRSFTGTTNASNGGIAHQSGMASGDSHRRELIGAQTWSLREERLAIPTLFRGSWIRPSARWRRDISGIAVFVRNADPNATERRGERDVPPNRLCILPCRPAFAVAGETILRWDPDASPDQ